MVTAATEVAEAMAVAVAVAGATVAEAADTKVISIWAIDLNYYQVAGAVVVIVVEEQG